jgi:hypothetical protein
MPRGSKSGYSKGAGNGVVPGKAHHSAFGKTTPSRSKAVTPQGSRKQGPTKGSRGNVGKRSNY